MSVRVEGVRGGAIRWSGPGRGRSSSVASGRAGPFQPVEAILECWQIDDEWWRSPISRLYYELVLEGGGVRVVYRDLTSGTWHLQ